MDQSPSKNLWTVWGKFISVDIFRDELTPRRKNMALKAFAMMDKNGSGTITIQDIAQIYDVSRNPEFIEKRKTKDQIL